MAGSSPPITLPRPDLFSEAPHHLAVIQEALHHILERSTNLWFQDVLDYMLTRQGKMLRGLLAIYSALGDSDSLPPDTYRVGSLCELLHIASLLHDDVLDEATTRRSLPSVNFKWSDKTAILVGDYILTRIFSNLSEIQRWDVLDQFILAARALSEGSLIEFKNRYNLSLTENEYFEIVTRKTSALFSCALVSGQLLGNGTEATIRSLSRYGFHLGIAFQITDDLLDYSGEPSVMGKVPLKDLRQGYVTLPFIRAFSAPPLFEELQRRFTESNASWKQFLEKNEKWITGIICAPENLAAISRVASAHRDLALKALSELPWRILRDRLAVVADWVVSREK